MLTPAEIFLYWTDRCHLELKIDNKTMIDSLKWPNICFIQVILPQTTGNVIIEDPSLCKILSLNLHLLPPV